MASRQTLTALGAGGIGNQRLEPCILCLLGLLEILLFEYRQFRGQSSQTSRQLPQLALDQPIGHGVEVYGWRNRLAVLVALTVASVSCSIDSSGSSTCSDSFAEPMAQDSLLHVLPGADPTYLTDPPTSGPHQAWAPPPILDRELSGPEQVGILERGEVLIQYQPRSSKASEIEEIGQGLPVGAHLAPNSNLDRPVVLTAWLTKAECSSLDLASINAFVARHAGDLRTHATR